MTFAILVALTNQNAEFIWVAQDKSLNIEHIEILIELTKLKSQCGGSRYQYVVRIEIKLIRTKVKQI
jgi:hypothetical protein